MSAIAQTHFGIQCSFWESPEKEVPLWPRTLQTKTGAALQNRPVKEMNPAKLMALVAKLCHALDRERGRKTEFQPQQDNQTGSFPDVA